MSSACRLSAYSRCCSSVRRSRFLASASSSRPMPKFSSGSQSASLTLEPGFTVQRLAMSIVFEYSTLELLNYAESVRYLYSLGNEIQTAKYGLDRITRLLDALGNPHRGCRFVHVAGTNGKGSTSAMIEAGLRAAGVRTGLYTSPHLVEPTERIRIASQAITADQFAQAFTEVHETAERMLHAGELDLHPTYFESVTAMAFLLYARERIDTVVLEVGMGGRLEAA